MIVYKNRYFKILYKKNFYIYTPNRPEVLILPIVEKKNFLLIKSKRAILGKSIYEFPAGSVNLKEKIINGAKREFQEETGITLNKNKFFKLNKIYQIPNRNPKFIHAYGVNIRRKQVVFNNFDKSEVDKIIIVSLNKILKMIEMGRFNTSVPLAILFNYLIKFKLVH